MPKINILKNHHSLTSALFAATASRIFVFITALVSNFFVGAKTGDGIWEAPIPFFNLFARWDSGYYMDIAYSGYHQPNFWAFFPLYPLLMRLTHIVLPLDMSLVGFLLSNIFFFLFIIYFYKLTANIFNPKIGFLSVVLVSFFPSSVFFSAVYAESLFLFLLVLSFYFLAEKKIAPSALAGFLTGLTRPFGFLTGLPHLFNGLVIRSPKEVIVSFAIFSSLPAVFFFAYLVTGNFWTFSYAESTYWDWDVGLISNPYDSFNVLTKFQKLLMVFIAASSVAALANFFRRKKWYLRKEAEYYIFFLFIFLFSLNTPLTSFARYALAFIPLFWYLAKVWSGHKKIGWTIFILFLTLNAYGTMLFTNWYSFF